MDHSRRKLLLGTSALPLSLMLPGCGGGDSASTQAQAASEGRATAQAAASAGNYIDFQVQAGKSVIDSVFRYTYGGTEYLRYFVPSASNSVTQAVLDDFGLGPTSTTKTMYVRMIEVIKPAGSTNTYHRALYLELPSFPAAGTSATYDGSVANRSYKGTLVVNVLPATGSASHYEYDLATGGIKVTHATGGGSFVVEFVGTASSSTDYVDGAVATNRSFSTTPTTVASVLPNTNLAANPLQLRTVVGGITVAYATENGAWI
jgi:hypothetical protein